MMMMTRHRLHAQGACLISLTALEGEVLWTPGYRLLHVYKNILAGLLTPAKL
jgi:hypothetical protein